MKCQLYIVTALTVILTIIVQQCSTHPYYRHENYKRFAPVNSQRYCGHDLSDALKFFCDGVYNHMFKRSEQETEDYEYTANSEYPETTEKLALSMMDKLFQRKTRHARGVADECCLKACTIQELTSYCGR